MLSKQCIQRPQYMLTVLLHVSQVLLTVYRKFQTETESACFTWKKNFHKDKHTITQRTPHIHLVCMFMCLCNQFCTRTFFLSKILNAVLNSWTDIKGNNS